MQQRRGVPDRPMNVTGEMKLRDTLVIGCGGFGLLTLAYLKRQIGKFLDLSSFKRIRFLGIDTMQNLETGSNPVLRELDNKDIRPLNRHYNFDQMLDSPASYPKVMESLPEFDQLDPVALSGLKEPVSGGPGAGTSRPSSRLCLRSLPDNIRSIREDIGIRFSGTGFEKSEAGRSLRLVEEDSTDVTYVFLASSLYGGTGAGIHLDIAALCRDIAKQKKRPTFIIGVYYLPAFLDHEQKPSHKANAYAALKELDHYLAGNRLTWEYPDNTRVDLSNASGTDKLLNMVFLVDTPMNGKLLQGNLNERRNQLAEAGAEFIFHLCASDVGTRFFGRQVDMAARENLFVRRYPSDGFEDASERKVLEQRVTAYSAGHFKTVGFDQQELRRFLLAEYAAELFDRYTLGTGEHWRKVEEEFTGFAGGPSLIQTLGVTYERMTKPYQSLLSPPDLPAQDDLPAAIARLADHYELTCKRIDQEIGRKSGEFRQLLEQALHRIVRERGPAFARTLLGRLRSHIQGETLRGQIYGRLEMLAGDTDPERRREAFQQLVAEAQASLKRAREEARQSFLGRGLRAAMSVFTLSPFRARRELARRMSRYLDPTRRRARKFACLCAEAYLLTQLRVYVESLPAEIDKLEKQYLLPLEERIEGVRARLQGWRKDADPRAGARPSLCFTHVAELLADFGERVKEAFRESLSPDASPAAAAGRLRREGLEVRPGESVSMDDLGNFTTFEILSAVLGIAKREINQSLKNFIVDFDDKHVFPYKPPTENPFEKLSGGLREAFEPLLAYNFEGDHERMTGVFANSLIRGEVPAWSDLICQEATEGGVPGLVTAYCLDLGFPLLALRDLRDWYLHYLVEIHRKRPVHAVKGAVYFAEPFFDRGFNPTEEEAQLLFLLASHEEIMAVRSDGSEGWILGNPEYAKKLRPELRGIFFDSQQEEPVYLPRDKILRLLKTNQVLANELKNRAINRIADRHYDTKKYPNFRWKEVRTQVLELAVETGLKREESNRFLERCEKEFDPRAK